MNKEKIAELEKAVEQIQLQIEELKKEDGTPSFKYPKEGDIVFLLNTHGGVEDFRWDGYDSDKAKFEEGNIFFTEEAAYFESRRRAVIKKLELFKEPEDREWNNSNNEHFYIIYDTGLKEVYIDSHQIVKGSEIYFSSRKDCQKAIDFVGENKVKKYYLRVEED